MAAQRYFGAQMAPADGQSVLVSIGLSDPPWRRPYRSDTLVVSGIGDVECTEGGQQLRFLRYHPLAKVATAQTWMGEVPPHAVTAVLWDESARRWRVGAAFPSFAIAVTGRYLWGEGPRSEPPGRPAGQALLRGVPLGLALGGGGTREGEADTPPRRSVLARLTAGLRRWRETYRRSPITPISALAVLDGKLVVVAGPAIWNMRGRWTGPAIETDRLRVRATCSACWPSAAMLSLEAAGFRDEASGDQYEVVWLRDGLWRGVPLGANTGQDARDVSLSPTGDHLMVYWPWTSKWCVYREDGQEILAGSSNSYPCWDASGDQVLAGTEGGLFRQSLSAPAPDLVTDEVVFPYVKPRLLRDKPGPVA